MKLGMCLLFDYLENIHYNYFLLLVEELNFSFQFFSFNCNFDFFLSKVTDSHHSEKLSKSRKNIHNREKAFIIEKKTFIILKKKL